MHQQQALASMPQAAAAAAQKTAQQMVLRNDRGAVSTADVFRSASNITTMVETVRPRAVSGTRFPLGTFRRGAALRPLISL